MRVGNNEDSPVGGGAGGSGALTALATGGESAISFVKFAPRAPYDDRLVFMRERGSDTAAAFRLLRQRLIDKGDPRIILCTSASRQEGKTTLAANLAMAYAELGRHRVLLVEASFRATALGELFGFLPPKGFATQLAVHRVRPQDPWVVVQIGGAPLYVLAADPRACANCARVLAEFASFCPMCGTPAAASGVPSGLDGVSFSTTIQAFRQSFDYLIIDAPPVLGSGDVNLIQDAADAIVFATRKGQTESRDLRRAIEQVAPAPVAAVALLDGLP
ncbi:MAG TPA: CpsD/CapB family tyrosine-protein kinase [Polyangia bacterium]|nr:CpsD/CapB family tyrosine-protein kinase [Polyangia bacterium]